MSYEPGKMTQEEFDGYPNKRLVFAGKLVDLFRRTPKVAAPVLTAGLRGKEIVCRAFIDAFESNGHVYLLEPDGKDCMLDLDARLWVLEP